MQSVFCLNNTNNNLLQSNGHHQSEKQLLESRIQQCFMSSNAQELDEIDEPASNDTT